MYYHVLGCIEMYGILRSSDMIGTHVLVSIALHHHDAACVSIHAGCTECPIHVKYAQKAMYWPFFGCQTVFENRGERHGCILDVLSCILDVFEF